jgi:hypothetical protein
LRPTMWLPLLLSTKGPSPQTIPHERSFDCRYHNGRWALLNYADSSSLGASRVTMALRECRLSAFPRVLFSFPRALFLGLAHARPFQEALTYSRSKMRAARSALGCAAPKSAMSSRHHGEARCDRRSRLGARCRRRGKWRRTVRSPTAAWCDDASAGDRTMANHGGRSRGGTRASSF